MHADPEIFLCLSCDNRDSAYNTIHSHRPCCRRRPTNRSDIQIHTTHRAFPSASCHQHFSSTNFYSYSCLFALFYFLFKLCTCSCTLQILVHSIYVCYKYQHFHCMQSLCVYLFCALFLSFCNCYNKA